MALPNPFQSATVPSPVFNTAPKTTQNDGNFFHGYRSNFNINQQKEQYEQRMMSQQLYQQQQQQQHQQKFNRNPQHQNRVNHPDNAYEKNNQNYGSNTSNWCDVCECGFKYPQQLEKHLGEHEKCWFDDCKFEGNSKLLQKHIEVQHQTTIIQRVGNVETEEDIEKWREERRKRYPTRANIEARRLAQEERLKRGERIAEPNNRFGNMKNRKSAQQRPSSDPTQNKMDRKKNDKKRRRNRTSKNKSEKNDVEKTSDKAETGIDSVKSEENRSELCPTEPKEKTTNALTSLGMYGSDSDTDCDNDAATAPENNVENKQDENVCIGVNITENVAATSDPNQETTESNEDNVDESIENSSRKRVIDQNDDGDEIPIKQLKIDSDIRNEPIIQAHETESDDDAPEEEPIQRQSNITHEEVEDVSGPTQTKPEQPKKSHSQALTNERMQKKRTVLDMTRRIRNQNTLLEKLLQKDIRHERNVLLQCVRYVVEQNFFGIGQKTDEQNNQIDKA